jgi:hypothetical protein
VSRLFQGTRFKVQRYEWYVRSTNFLRHNLVKPARTKMKVRIADYGKCRSKLRSDWGKIETKRGKSTIVAKFLHASLIWTERKSRFPVNGTWPELRIFPSKSGWLLMLCRPRLVLPEPSIQYS